MLFLFIFSVFITVLCMNKIFLYNTEFFDLPYFLEILCKSDKHVKISIKFWWNPSGTWGQMKAGLRPSKTFISFYKTGCFLLVAQIKCNPAAGPILHTNLFKEQLVFIWTLRNQNNSRKVLPWKTPTWKILTDQTPIW